MYGHEGFSFDKNEVESEEEAQETFQANPRFKSYEYATWLTVPGAEKTWNTL